MRAILVPFIALAAAFVFVGTSVAAPGGDVKASPLFKRSLEESIAKLEGKAPEATEQSEAEPMPTGRLGCPQPDLPETQASTCEPSVCGGVTCGGPTCQGWPTCYNTCSTTCGSQSTCLSTCAGGVCPYHYIWRGYNNWNYNGMRSSDWNLFVNVYPYASCVYGGDTEIRFVGANPPPTERQYWYPNNGYFNIDKWYSNPITNLYDVQSEVWLKDLSCNEPFWIIYWSQLVHYLNPPDASGRYHPVEFYF